MTSYMDIEIIDLNGTKYNINSIRTYGNDKMILVIKTEDENYIEDDKIDNLIKKVE